MDRVQNYNQIFIEWQTYLNLINKSKNQSVLLKLFPIRYCLKFRFEEKNYSSQEIKLLVGNEWYYILNILLISRIGEFISSQFIFPHKYKMYPKDVILLNKCYELELALII